MRDVAATLALVLSELERQQGFVQWIGDYQILRDLRTGATGRTVVARRRDFPDEVVLKIAPLGQEATLHGEVELLRAFDHPNIVRANTAVRLARERSYVGEFRLVKGQDCERLRGTRLGASAPGDLVGKLATGLFDALVYVHSRGYVHRDVKPANVILGPDGTATLLDFGLAAKLSDAEAMADLIVGTAPYKSQDLFERGQWTTGDDVFAATVTFWETVSGRHPWGGDAPSGSAKIEAADLGALFDDVTRDRLAATIGTLLHKAPTGMHAARDAKERIIAALRDVGTGEPLALWLAPTIELPKDAKLTDPLTRVALNERARDALEVLGLLSFDDARRLRAADLARVRTFGRLVGDELLALSEATIGRFGEPREAASTSLRSVAATVTPLAAILVADPQARDDRIEVLGVGSALRAALASLPFAPTSVAELATLAPAQLEIVPQIGLHGVAELRAKLQVYVEDREGLVTDAVLPSWRMMPRAAFVDAAVRIGAKRDDTIAVLHRAGGFVLEPSSIPTLREGLVALPPWTEAAARAFVSAVAETLPDVPTSLDRFVVDVLESALDGGADALAGFDADQAQGAVETVTALLTTTARTADRRVYRRGALTTTVVFKSALDGLDLPKTAAAFLSAVAQRFPDEALPVAGTPEFADVLARAGLTVSEDGSHVERQSEQEAGTADPAGKSDLDGAELVRLSTAAQSLVATASSGYRLVVAEPAVYARRIRGLIGDLRSAFGPDQVRVIDLDAQFCAALAREGLLEAAFEMEVAQGAQHGVLALLAKGVAVGLLDQIVQGPVVACTIITNPACLALAGAEQHLGAIYDRVRGGAHGLVVVTVPGDHPREHARLNRMIPLPHVPTSRPIALEEAA
jgi:hypothetical protein